MADSPFDALSGPAQTIGRYFSTLAIIPSALLVTFFLVLSNANTGSGDPDFGAGFAALGDGGFTKIAQIVLASLLVGLVLHPLQYLLVQVAEGYWGTSNLATALMLQRIRHHRKVRKALRSRRTAALKNLKTDHQSPLDAGHGPITDDNLVHLISFDEASRALLSYPHRPNDVRPTRLGNVLRRYESEGGAPYGLGIPTVAPHLGLIAPREHIEFVNDQRTQLDLAIRLAVVSLIACIVAIAFLWRDGLWLLVTLIPYALAYLFYRGAVNVAADYGTALATVTDVDRFLLYEKLHLAMPETIADERTQAGKLMAVLRGDNHPVERAEVKLVYAPVPTRGSDREPTQEPEPGRDKRAERRAGHRAWLDIQSRGTVGKLWQFAVRRSRPSSAPRRGD